MRENILYVWLVWKHGCSRWTSAETCKSRPSESVSPRRNETGSSPKAPARKVAQATRSTFWASEHLAQAIGVWSKRDPALLPASPFEPSPRRKGARLSEHISPERDPSAWARDWARQCAVWVFVYSWMIDIGLCVNCMMRNMYIMEYYACLAWITNCVWRV